MNSKIYLIALSAVLFTISNITFAATPKQYIKSMKVAHDKAIPFKKQAYKDLILSAYWGLSNNMQADQEVVKIVKEINNGNLPKKTTAKVELPEGKDNAKKFENLFEKGEKNNFGYQVAIKMDQKTKEKVAGSITNAKP